MNRPARALVFLLALACCFPVRAAEPEIELKAVEVELEGASKEQKVLEVKATKAEQELKKSQETLVELARQQRENERAITKAEQALTALTRREEEGKKALEERRASLSKVMNAMINLGIVPPEAVLAMPGEAKDTITATAVLETVLKNLETESAALRAEMEELEKIRAEAEQVRAQLEQEKQTLVARRKEMESVHAGRAKSFAQLHSDAESKKKETRELAKKASSLKDLFSRLKRLEDARPVPKPSPGAPKIVPKKEAAHREGKGFAKARGSLTLPVSGKIISAYGAPLSAGNRAQGIKIATRASAQVVSPYDGEVVYTGPFLDYGNIVILRHDKHYHSLIAGVETIQVSPGQFVLEGEPVGAMGNTEEAPRLYMEIRKDNKPVDPSPWLAANIEG